VGREKEKYRAYHGFGYSRVTAEIERISSEVTFFVPKEDNQEIWKAVFHNPSSKTRNLSIYGYVEFCLGHAFVDLVNQCDDQHFNRLFYRRENHTLFATKTYWVTEHSGTQQQENQAWDHWAFFTVSEPVAQYETLRERFIGPFRNENNPLALESGELSSQDTDYGNAVGVLRIDLSLEPGEEKCIAFSLGVIPKEDYLSRIDSAPKKYHDMALVDQALDRVHDYWNAYFQHNVIQTPERETDLFLNYWIPYQARVTFDVGRVASFYYWGISRGFGFRDTAQDAGCIPQSDPNEARERVLLLARQMFKSGKVLHHFIRDGQGETTEHCDDPFWFILAVTDYILETGDAGILEQVEPFLDGGNGTLLDHCMAVTQRARAPLGTHGLPLFGRGDWNDTLDYIGGEEGGESVWGGLFFCAMLRRLAALLDFLGQIKDARKLEALRDGLAGNINKYCWDGEWYIRAFGAGGRKLGSHENEAGKIFLNPQSWAVIAGVADRDRLIQCMDSVKEHLDSDFGPKICAPAYREIDPKIGLVTRCTPGKKENGAVFCHPVTWAIMAECLLGRGNQAYRYFKNTLPNRVDSDLYCAEPYVYSQYITSDEHESPGRASHSWQTGTAAWMKRVMQDYFLGVRATYEGLKIDPVIPSFWHGFKIERVFGGTRYKIEVENPDGVESGVKGIEMDGTQIHGKILPIIKKRECTVRVVLGP
jgi:cellobiose phosphorylase